MKNETHNLSLMAERLSLIDQKLANFHSHHYKTIHELEGILSEFQDYQRTLVHLFVEETSGKSIESNFSKRQIQLTKASDSLLLVGEELNEVLKGLKSSSSSINRLIDALCSLDVCIEALGNIRTD